LNINEFAHCWCYEVTIRALGHAQIGWIDKEFTGTLSPCLISLNRCVARFSCSDSVGELVPGADTHSWVLEVQADGNSAFKHNGQRQPLTTLHIGMILRRINEND
jgi:hypothetical protein